MMDNLKSKSRVWSEISPIGIRYWVYWYRPSRDKRVTGIRPTWRSAMDAVIGDSDKNGEGQWQTRTT